MSEVLSGWLEEGIAPNVGTAAQPKYRRLMKLQEKRKVKAKQESQRAVPAGPQVMATQGIEITNGNGE